ncbi:thiopurine S-methyltransferase [Elongatibacter sediminis]|uniref:Thiopurine S-methyltransferase n=1 Tax=Elongatibacter sediminis TaxID=3119006 RepID=A0AAW9RGD8_9GAMM
MREAFWHECWERGEIGFHEGEPNGLLVRHFDRLNLPEGSRVFLPLCGKTRDLAWLAGRGLRMVGAELSEQAVKQLFEESGLQPEVSPAGALDCYRAGRLEIFVGDLFDLTADQLGPVDAVYDRAALVALPEEMRVRYTAHLVDITGTAPQLLVTFEYDQAQMAGPPFSLVAEEVRGHYAAQFEIERLESREVTGGLKGQVEANETAWLLQPRN